MEFLVVTGQSGAGKSRTASTLEDLGFYCVDNLPPELIQQFAEVCLATTGRFEKVALVCDVRAGQSFEGLLTSLDALNTMGLRYSIVFVEAENEVIIKRYKESRRSHPLSRDGSSLLDAVSKEKQLLKPVRERANYIINTTALSTAQLRNELIRLLMGDKPERAMTVNVLSFGFKYGLPVDADLVFDVRFLPNPYYIPELKPKSGLMPEVRDFVFSFQQTKDFMARLEDMMAFLLPHYFEEGKTTLVIAVGCTGGRHRSVAVARALGEYVEKRGYPTAVNHRDMSRG